MHIILETAIFVPSYSCRQDIQGVPKKQKTIENGLLLELLNY